MSKLLLLLSKNEPFARKNMYFSPCFWKFFIASPFYAQERIAPIALYKRATEVIRSFPRANRFFALSLTKNEWFAQKTKERIPNPAYFAGWYFALPVSTAAPRPTAEALPGSWQNLCKKWKSFTENERAIKKIMDALQIRRMQYRQ